MTTPLKLTSAQAKRLEKNLHKQKVSTGNQQSELEIVLRKAKSVFDHAGNSNDLWMAEKYIDKAIALVKRG